MFGILTWTVVSLFLFFGIAGLIWPFTWMFTTDHQ